MDIGCATGEFTHVLARHARRDTTVVGVDCVTAAIDRARRKFPHLTFRKESVLALGRLYPAHFDLITCLEVLYYLEKDAQQEAIRSACRTLRPGGYAVFSSFLSSPPHFSPARLGDLLSQEFQIVAVHLVHLRLVTAFEKVAMKVDGFIAPARRRLPRTRIPTVGWIAMRGVIAAEAVSRLLGPLAASHAIILTRRPI
jgi:2-polyprenyl-3-methyl-5-hydroxy-6-metoxy-1,4-benzoquinol methylase